MDPPHSLLSLPLTPQPAPSSAPDSLSLRYPWSSDCRPEPPPRWCRRPFSRSSDHKIFGGLLQPARYNTAHAAGSGHRLGPHWYRPRCQPVSVFSSMEWQSNFGDLLFSLLQRMAPATSLASTKPAPNRAAENTSQLLKQKPYKKTLTWVTRASTTMIAALHASIATSLSNDWVFWPSIL